MGGARLTRAKTSEGRGDRTSSWTRVRRGFERREQGRLSGENGGVV